VNQEAHRPGAFRATVHALVVAAVFLAGYASDVGRGFIKEDATWILRSRLETPSSLTHLLTDTGGFFRPVVALSFAANYWMFGNRPAGYGWTNLLLAAAVAFSIYRLARVLGLPHGAAVLASSLWLLSFHGINMAVIWLSGRTALLLILFATLAATEAARHRLPTTCLFAFLALLSKEEAVFLPVSLLAVLWFGPNGRPRRGRLVAFIVGLSVVMALYGLLRASSDAQTPSTAPAFYRFTVAPDVLGKNIVEYADRVLTMSVAVALLGLVIGGVRPALERRERHLLVIGGVWIAAALALTLFLPVRSSLYALFPSVGATIACASLLSATWRSMTPSRRRVVSVVALIVPLTFIPVYWTRNTRWTDLADVSREVTRALGEISAAAASDWRVVIVDEPHNRSNVAAALDWSLPDAVELTTGRRPHVWLIPAPPDSAPADIAMAPAAPAAIFALRGKRIVPVTAEAWKPALAGEMH
jgi:hypothetical protein